MEIDATFDATEEEIYYTTQRVLVREGYPLARTDRDTGAIVTWPRRVGLTPEQIDCGDPAESGAVAPDSLEADVLFEARAEPNGLMLRAIMEAVIRPGASIPERPITCTSTGVFERRLMEKIRADIDA